MSDGTTVDSLQIEIEASSAEAEKKVDALAAALERLKKATTGFGNIGERIRDIGSSASDTPAAAKTRQRRKALDRATGKTGGDQGLGDTSNLEKLQAEYRKVGEALDQAAEKYEELQRYAKASLSMGGGYLTEEENEKLREANKLVEDLTARYSELYKQIRAARTGQSAVPDTKKTSEDPWAEIKAQLKGSTLGDLVGDTGSVDEAVSRMVDLNDQVSLLNVKLEGLQEKLRGAFEKGNQSQVASYTAQIQKLKDQLAELQNAPAQAQDSEVEMVESETSLQKKLGILQRISETVQKMSGTKIDIGSAGGLKELLGKDLSLQSLIPKGAASGIKALEGAFGGLKDKMLGVAAAHPILAAALIGVVIAVKTVGSEMKKLAQSAYSAAKKGFELLAAGAKKLTSALKNLVTTGIGKAVSGLKSVGKSVASSFTRPFTDALGAYNKWKSAIGRIAFYRAVREAIKAVTDGFKTGIENLYQYSRLVGTEFAPAMNSLATSALYLKNSLGAMAAPLIQAVAPAIDFLIDKFVALINVIGKAFAMLTGKSVYTQAKKHAVEYGEAANSAAKATKDFLLGIDELNVLNDSSGGGGGAAEDFGSMFEEVEIDQDQFDWVKQIREAIENGEWRQVGELVAKKLNEIVDSWDSYAWGAKLGGLLNNGLNVAYGFLDKFDFENLGRKVANGLNGLFDKVDWDLLGRTFAAKWNALFDFIYGFATTLKWHEIGLDIAEAINGFLDELDTKKAAEAISKFIVGIFDTINTAISETNWDVLGAKLAEFLNNVDWYGAIYGALSIITNGLDALKEAIDSFLKNWKWKDMAKQVYEAINKAWKDVDWPGLGKTLGELVITALKFAVDVISHIDWLQIGRDIGNFLISIDWVEVFGGLTDVIAAGITAAVGALGGLIDTIAPKMKEIATGIAQKVNEFFDKIDWAETGRVLSKGIEAALDFMITFMQEVDWDSIGRHIAEFLENIDWDTLLTKWGQLLGEFMSAKMKLIDVSGILEVGANIVKGLWDGWWAEWEAGGGILGWLKREFLDKFLGAIKELFGIHSPSTVMAEIGGYLIEGLLQGIKDTWNSIVEFFQSAFGPIADIIEKAWDLIHGDTRKKLTDISETTTGMFEGIKTGLEPTMSQMVGIIGQAWDTTSIDTSSEWENIANNLNTTWSGINKDAGTKFGEVERTVSDAWNKSDVNTNANWAKIDGDLIKIWGTINENAGLQFGKVQDTIKGTWENTNKDSSTLIGELRKQIHDDSKQIEIQADQDFKEVAKKIKNPLEETKKDSKTWGSDICKGLADGMRGAIGGVSSAAKSVASKISEYLHFSEPDIGPLSDFHTYMPDMLDLMSRGIKDNTYKAVNAASALADAMSRTLGNIEPVEPKFSNLPSYEMSFSTANLQGREGAPNYSVSPDSGTGGNDNSELISAFYAAAGMIVEAIQNQDNGVYLDGKQLMQSVEKSQRQRGADIMGGGVLY